MAKKTSWFMRRHNYRPESIGLIEPSHDTGVLPVTTPDLGMFNAIDAKMDRTNSLLEELLDIQYHNMITDDDIDVSDSATYTLSSGEAGLVSYKVPDDYTLLLREFNTSLFYDSLYYVYLNDEIFQYTSDMEFPGNGLPIESGVTFNMYVLNTHPASQEYTSVVKASLRRNVNWEYPRRSYRIPV